MEWASEEMKGDRELCKAAVAQLKSLGMFSDTEIKEWLGRIGIPEAVLRDALTK